MGTSPRGSPLKKKKVLPLETFDLFLPSFFSLPQSWGRIRNDSFEFVSGLRPAKHAAAPERGSSSSQPPAPPPWAFQAQFLSFVPVSTLHLFVCFCNSFSNSPSFWELSETTLSAPIFHNSASQSSASGTVFFFCLALTLFLIDTRNFGPL